MGSRTALPRASSFSSSTMRSSTVALLVLLAPAVLTAAQTKDNCVMKVLADNPELSSLKAAVESTGLSKGLACGASENTIFAPTNAAFEALPAVPEGDDLENVLKLHVIPGVALKAADLQDGSQTVDTLLDGQKLEVTKETEPAVQAMQSTEG